MRNTVLFGLALALTGCLAEDDMTGTHLTQPPPSAEPRKPVDLNDIVIVGQVVAHAILDLPAVSGAPTPPLVQFTGVSSIVKFSKDNPMVLDTDPYTQLFRDRLLLITREKLRFVERTLPPLVVAPKKGKKPVTPPKDNSADPDYVVLAELRGNYKDELFKIQVQFVDAHTGDVLFDGLYRIRKEAADESPTATDVPASPPPPVIDPMTQPTTAAPL